MAFFTLSKIERKRLSLFVICLGAAVLLWLFFSLSGKYTYFIRTRISYQNPPRGLVFHPLQPDTLTLQVEGTGWQLLFSKLQAKVPFVKVDIGELNRSNFVALPRQIGAMNKRMAFNQRVLSINPDTLYFDFARRSIKKVPIQLAAKLLFKKQHALAGPVVFLPDSVTITGPSNHLKGISAWKTDSLKLNNVSTTIRTNLMLEPSLSSIISVFPSTVQVTIAVDEFTEKTIELPIKVRNNKFYAVKLLPEKVKVTFLVGLNQYKKVGKETFNAIVDLDKWSKKKYSQLPVQLEGFPENCKILRIEPQTVDFMIQE